MTLYGLCKELLSKQAHYDCTVMKSGVLSRQLFTGDSAGGLRAIKSVLVVAGVLKRADKDRSEDQVRSPLSRVYLPAGFPLNFVKIAVGVTASKPPNMEGL